MWIYLILTARLQRYRLNIFLYITVALLAASFCLLHCRHDSTNEEDVYALFVITTLQYFAISKMT